MSDTMRGQPHRCLGDTQVLDLASGRYCDQRVRALLKEAENCEICQILLREAGWAIAEEQSDTGALSPLETMGSTFESGQLVSNRYRIEQNLGCGGMGEVYQAFDVELEERIALKTIRSGMASNLGSIERLRQELRLARSVVHPNLCRVFEFGRHPSGNETPDAECSYYFTMELLLGQSLSHLLNSSGPLRAEQAVGIVRQVSDGLAAVHTAGVLHRDIKTSNVMLCRGKNGDSDTSRAVLLDFGIARTLSAEPKVGDGKAGEYWWVPTEPSEGLYDSPSGKKLTGSNHRIGTPPYMAPEQLETGRALTPATDIYALGVVLFELLSGQLPARAEGTWDDARTRQAVAEVCKKSPRGLAPVLFQCLAYQPSARPQSAAKLRDALNAILTAPNPLTSSQSIRRQSKRATWLAASALVIAGAALTLWVAAPSPSRGDAVPRVADASRDEALQVQPSVATAAPDRAKAEGLGRNPPKPIVVVPSNGETRAKRSEDTPVHRGGDGSPAAGVISNTRAVDSIAKVSKSRSTQSKPDQAKLPESTRAKPKLPKRAKQAIAAEPALTSSAAEADCSPPYYFSSRGVKVYRKECL